MASSGLRSVLVRSTKMPSNFFSSSILSGSIAPARPRLTRGRQRPSPPPGDYGRRCSASSPRATRRWSAIPAFGHGALQRELVPALARQLCDHRAAAGLLPQPAKGRRGFGRAGAREDGGRSVLRHPVCISRQADTPGKSQWRRCSSPNMPITYRCTSSPVLRPGGHRSRPVDATHGAPAGR